MDSISRAKNTGYNNNLNVYSNVNSIPIYTAKFDIAPKVTIGIPTYKRTELLKEALESAINQELYSDYEILVVDNNPERNCPTEKLMMTFDNQKISYYKNSECIEMVGNTNRIYQLAKGEYVVELHDDDILYSDFLSVLMDFMKRTAYKYSAVYPDLMIYNMNESDQKPEKVKKSQFALEIKESDFLWQGVVSAPERIMKRQSFIEIGGYDKEYYPVQDLHLFYRFAKEYETCRLYGNPLCIYRISKNVSACKENILGFVKFGTEIRKNIVHQKKYSVLRFFWSRYNVVFNYRLLKDGRKIFNNKEIQAKEDLKLFGQKLFKSDFLIFLFLHYCHKISITLRKKRI